MTPLDFKCPRRVGFLFPHACERLSPVGCPDCQNGSIVDPFRQRSDRYGYNDYDDYDDYHSGRMGGGSALGFSQADGEHLVKPHNKFEDDMSAS